LLLFFKALQRIVDKIDNHARHAMLDAVLAKLVGEATSTWMLLLSRMFKIFKSKHGFMDDMGSSPTATFVYFCVVFLWIEDPKPNAQQLAGCTKQHFIQESKLWTR